MLLLHFHLSDVCIAYANANADVDDACYDGDVSIYFMLLMPLHMPLLMTMLTPM